MINDGDRLRFVDVVVDQLKLKLNDEEERKRIRVRLEWPLSDK